MWRPSCRTSRGLQSSWASTRFTFTGRAGKARPCFARRSAASNWSRSSPRFDACTAVMEACAGAHHMARKQATFGHRVKLISPQCVRRFVKGNQNDSSMPRRSAKRRCARSCGSSRPRRSHSWRARRCTGYAHG
ncbi:putative transposase, IS110 family (plasmid) [Ralstonia solanacearum Po82]|uniref:Putative transposase, IS110 family n=1 Tax=Ralstonia solanacearum (strain Po82) TaxID=1031711 RepID=F6GBJ7_RALS8|nr:putative transposase, IS110 family [Ralstonia solanacearum Po82]